MRVSVQAASLIDSLRSLSVKQQVMSLTVLHSATLKRNKPAVAYLRFSIAVSYPNLKRNKPFRGLA